MKMVVRWGLLAPLFAALFLVRLSVNLVLGTVLGAQGGGFSGFASEAEFWEHHNSQNPEHGH